MSYGSLGSLSWVFVEGANFAKRYNDNCRRWYDRKAARTSPIIATKALACKMAKAAWHVMKNGVVLSFLLAVAYSLGAHGAAVARKVPVGFEPVDVSHLHRDGHSEDAADPRQRQQLRIERQLDRIFRHTFVSTIAHGSQPLSWVVRFHSTINPHLSLKPLLYMVPACAVASLLGVGAAIVALVRRERWQQLSILALFIDSVLFLWMFGIIAQEVF